MRSRLTSLILLVLAALSFFAAARLNPELRDMRRDLKITQADPLENAPPMVAFTTVALGGFRGVLADLLWLRAGRLQEEGRYFELVQLADWITKLEPRFTSVWSFHAWNLAYNISVLFDDPEDRWRWVNSGIALLRDEGLRYNPDNARLLYELGWMYQHKIGANLDQAHLFYKRRLAEDMMSLFPGPRPDFGALQAARQSSAMRDTPLGKSATTLMEVYKLDPKIMQEVDAAYGPLDWRVAQTHSIYWGYRSRLVASGQDALSAERMIFQSLADAFRIGALFVNLDEDVFIPSPNLDLLPRVLQAYTDAEKQFPDNASIRNARRTFCEQAMMILYTYQRNRQGQALFEDLKNRGLGDDLPEDYESFIKQRFTEEVKNMNDKDALAYVEGFLVQSLFFTALGDAERAHGFEQTARAVWQ